MYYLNCFFIYSIFGYLFETFFAIITKSGFKSGILYGPITPIYGIGTVIILLFSKYFFINLHLPRWLETIIVFIVLAIFLSCIELLGGILIEKFFHISFWSYEYQRFNIGKYISLEMTFIWGIASIFFIYIINPLLDYLIKKVPLYLSYIFIFIFITDLIITCYIRLKK